MADNILPNAIGEPRVTYSPLTIKKHASQPPVSKKQAAFFGLFNPSIGLGASQGRAATLLSLKVLYRG